MSLFLFGNFNSQPNDSQIGGYDYEQTFAELNVYLSGKAGRIHKVPGNNGNPPFLKIIFYNNNLELRIYQQHNKKIFSSIVVYARGDKSVNSPVPLDSKENADLQTIKERIDTLLQFNQKAEARRVEEEKRRVEEEKRRVEEEKRRVEEEKRRVEEEKRIEEEKRKSEEEARRSEEKRRSALPNVWGNVSTQVKQPATSTQKTHTTLTQKRPASLPAMPVGGSSIIVFYRKDGKTYILTGKESVFLSDSEDKEFLKPYQEFDGSYDKAPAFFDQTTREINRLFAGSRYGRIKYDQIEQFFDEKSNKQKYKVNLRVALGKFGIPKGGKKDNETPYETARRELMEECGNVFGHLGTLVKIANPDFNGYTVYALELTGGNIKIAQNAIADKNASLSGELYFIDFTDIDHINLNGFNEKSKYAINNFKEWNSINMPKTQDKTPKKYEAEGGYYQKYLKYKLKYLALKKQLNN